MKNNFQSKSVPRGTRTIWRYLSALFLLFTLGIGQMWADLTAHVPGVYEKTVATGGYGCTLTTVASGENAGTFEVYYFSAQSKYSENTTVYNGGTKQQYRLMCADSDSEYQLINRSGTGTFTASCDWIEMAYATTGFSKSDYTFGSNKFNEFFEITPNGGNTGITKTCYIKPKEGDVLTLKVSGYVEFAILGADNGSSKYMTITVDGGTPTSWKSNTLSRRSVELTTGEHTIVVANVGTSANNFYGFSLKVPSCSTEITTQPSGATLAVGDANPTLSVVATNAASYAWKESSDGTSYDGGSTLASTASFTPEVNDAVQTKYYYCEVTSDCDGTTVVKSNIVTVNVVGAITYYTVTLVPAGGTIVDATGWTLNAGNYEKEVAEGTVLTLPTFTKTDRTFKTWRKAGPADVASPVTVDGDLSLTAIWTATIEQVIYSWEGAEGGATEVGGTAHSSTDGGSSFDDAQINVPQAGYYCIQLNGGNSYADKMVEITLSGDEKVKTGDKIKYTGFYNNADTKNAAPKMRAADGTAIFSGSNLPNITTSEPRTDTHVVPSGINTATVQLTRAQTQSSSFLANLQIIRDVQVEEGDLLTVTFNSNGGSSIDPVLVASGQTVAKPADPTKAHNRFNEWQLSGSAYNFSTPVTSSITLDATWTPLYTVTYAANGGSGTMTDANEYAAGDEVTLLENTFEAPDVTKIWDSWAVTDALDNPVSVSAGKFAMPSSNATVTAQWTTISDFDVKFFQGYGDPDVQIGETQSISTGNFAVAPADPTREGYNFKGWSYDATEEHIVNVAEYAITAATNFTAIWKQVFIVTFDGAGSVNVESGSKVASPDSPTQAGKVFQGWYNGEDKFNFATGVTGNLALTSKWADADPNHYVYAYNDDFHFDGVVYKTPEGAVDAGSGTSNIAMTTPYTLFAGAEGITSIVMTDGIYDSKTGAIQAVTALMKVNNNATSKLTVTIKSGYTATLKIKSSGYSATRTISVSDATPASGTTTGQAVTSGAMSVSGIGELSFAINSGSHDLTVTGGTLYIAELDIEATALPTHSVTYKPGDGEGAWVVDADATEVADCPGTFTAPTGKVFNGWKNESDDSDVAVGAIVEDDMNLIAQWINHYAVTFNLQGHGDAIDPQDIKEGAKAAKPADPVVMGWDFGGWFTDAECTAGNEFDFETPITAATPLFAKWTADPCPDKKSIVKAVMATNTTATVTGYNSNEYAGGFIINNLADDASNTNMYDFGEGEVKGFKLKGSNSAIFATLSKGGFEVGDQVVFAVTKNSDANKLAIYAAKDKDHVLKLVELDVDAAGIYTYRLTQDNIDAIEAAGSDYLSIGTFRGDYNPYIYSVELKGCRSWSVFHTLTFKNIDGTATIAAEPLEEGAAASTVAPIAPKIAMKRFLGWAEAVDGTPVDLTAYTITEDKILYAVYEDIVCPTSGTVYKFQLKTDLTNGNIFTSAPGELTLNTTDHLSSMVNGEVTVNLASGKNTNRVQFYDGKAIGFANGDGASITLTLDCALATGDEIRFINYAGNGNKMNLSDGAHSLELNGNSAETVQKITVNSDWNGADELTLTRGGNTPKLTYFEIYRPAKFDVSFNMMGHGTQIADIEDVIEGSKITAPTAPTDENYSFSAWYKENELENEWDFDNDVVVANTTLFAKWLDKSDATLKSLKYGDTEIALEDGVYTYEVNVPGFLTAVPALTAVTSNPSATAAISDATEFDGEGKATSTVEVTPEKEGAAHQTYTVKFTKLPLYTDIVDVTDYTEWSWAGVATAEVKINDVANRGVILANYIDAPNFEMLAGQENARAYRSNSYPAYQGTYLKFHATVPGRLTINARNSSGSPILRVNGIDLATLNGTRTNYVTAVPAGDVEITSSADEIRIYAMTFDPAVDYTRDVTEGKYGTICLPTNGVMIGTTIYTLAFYGATSQKIFFDEVVTGRMEAGKPYLFLPEQGVTELKVFYTDSETKAAQAVNGFHGYIGDSEDPEDALQVEAGVGNYIVQNNTYREVQAGATAYILSHRAYITFSEITPTEPAKAPGARRIGLGKDAAQGFENLQSGDQPMKVMIDGTLYIIRGEKVYNANGQVVK